MNFCVRGFFSRIWTWGRRRINYTNVKLGMCWNKEPDKIKKIYMSMLLAVDLENVLIYIPTFLRGNNI